MINIAKYCQLVSSIVSQGSAGWNAPRMSEWVVSGAGGTSVTIAPPVIEVGIVGGTTEISLLHRHANLPVTIEGWGGGVTAGVDISIPWVGVTYAGGEIGMEGMSLGQGISLPSGGIGSIIAGPKANSVIISPNDLVTNSAERNGTPFLTILSGAVGTGMQYSLGVALFADRPIIETVDLAYTKAVALVYGMQLEIGSAIGGNVSATYFSIKIRQSSLPSTGARYGMSIPRP